MYGLLMTIFGTGAALGGGVVGLMDGDNREAGWAFIAAMWAFGAFLGELKELISK